MQSHPSLKVGKKEIIFIIVAILALAIALIKPIQGIQPLTTYTLSLFIVVIVAWIFKPFQIPWSISGLFFLAMLVLIGVSLQPSSEWLCGLVFLGSTCRSILWLRFK